LSHISRLWKDDARGLRWYAQEVLIGWFAAIWELPKTLNIPKLWSFLKEHENTKWYHWALRPIGLGLILGATLATPFGLGALLAVGAELSVASILTISLLAAPAANILVHGLWNMVVLCAVLVEEKKPDDMEALAKKLETPGVENVTLRSEASHALVEIGEPAVPVLIRVLEEGKNEFAINSALVALGKVGPDAKDAVPAIMKLFSNPHLDILLHAAVTLGKIGPGAIEAVPALLDLLGRVGEDSGHHATIIKALDAIGVAAALDRISQVTQAYRREHAEWRGKFRPHDYPGEPEIKREDVVAYVRMIEAILRSDDRQTREDAIKVLLTRLSISRVNNLCWAPGLFRPDDAQKTSVVTAGVVSSQVKAGEHVLDVGCGTGFQAINAITNGAGSAVCIDNNPVALIVTLLNAEELGLLDKISVDFADVRNLEEWQVPDERLFDRIIFNAPTPRYLGELTGDELIEFMAKYDQNAHDINSRGNNGFVRGVDGLLAKDGVVNFSSVENMEYRIRRAGFLISERYTHQKYLTVFTFTRKRDVSSAPSFSTHEELPKSQLQLDFPEPTTLQIDQDPSIVLGLLGATEDEVERANNNRTRGRVHFIALPRSNTEEENLKLIEEEVDRVGAYAGGITEDISEITDLEQEVDALIDLIEEHDKDHFTHNPEKVVLNNATVERIREVLLTIEERSSIIRSLRTKALSAYRMKFREADTEVRLQSQNKALLEAIEENTDGPDSKYLPIRVTHFAHIGSIAREHRRIKAQYEEKFGKNTYPFKPVLILGDKLVTDYHLTGEDVEPTLAEENATDVFSPDDVFLETTTRQTEAEYINLGEGQDLITQITQALSLRYLTTITGNNLAIGAIGKEVNVEALDELDQLLLEQAIFVSMNEDDGLASQLYSIIVQIVANGNNAIQPEAMPTNGGELTPLGSNCFTFRPILPANMERLRQEIENYDDILMAV